MKTTNRFLPLPALLALAALSVLWGYNWVMMKLALSYSDPFDFAVLRTLLGAACLWAILLWQRRPLRPTRFADTLFLGLTQTSAYFLLSIWALVEGGAGKTAVLVFVMPFWVLLMAWPILGERVQGSQWVAVVLAFLGLVLILEPWGLASSRLSKTLAALAGVAWAVSSVHAKRMQRKGELDVLSVTFWQMLYGLAPIIVVALLVPSRPVQWTGPFVIALLYNGLLSTAAGGWLWLYILQRLPAGAAGMSSLAIPVIAILTSWIHLGEVPSIAELTGMVLVAVALGLLSLRAMLLQRRAMSPASEL